MRLTLFDLLYPIGIITCAISAGVTGYHDAGLRVGIIWAFVGGLEGFLLVFVVGLVLAVFLSFAIGGTVFKPRERKPRKSAEKTI